MTWIGALVIVSSAQTWSMVVGGDLMLNGIPAGQNPFTSIQAVVSSADIALANLEVPLTDATVPTENKTAEEIENRDQFVLRADPAHTRYIGMAGFDMLSLANNHTMDYGEQGLTETTEYLFGQGLLYTGAGKDANEAFTPTIYRMRNGFRVGMISCLCFVTADALRKCTPARVDAPGVAVLSFNGVINEVAKKKLESWIGRTKKSCDFLIVAAHWGIERQTVPRSYQVQLGRAMVDAGADLVWGHHPHVLQGAELYKGTPILYSMGNLISPLGGPTALVQMTFKGTKLQEFKAIPCSIASGKVKPLEGKEAKVNPFVELSKTLKQKFPSEHSKPLN